jgi:hypothetical protein
MMRPEELRPGDCLVYRPSSLFGKLIAIKSWSNYSHVEMITDTTKLPFKAISARSEGVRYFSMNWMHIGAVMRPPSSFNLHDGLAWFDRSANGQRYDWFGILRFFTIGKQSTDHQFCSEVITRVYRHGGITLFEGQDADLVPPGWFVTLSRSDGFTQVWSDGKP